MPRRRLIRCSCGRATAWAEPRPGDATGTTDERCRCGAHLTLTVLVDELAGVLATHERWMRAGRPEALP